MPNSPPTLQTLHQSLIASLLRKLRQPRPAALILMVARMFLRDQCIEHRNDEAALKALRRIQRLYVQRLTEAVAAGKPSLALLTEVRIYAESVRISEAHHAQPLGSPDLGLPFNTD